MAINRAKSRRKTPEQIQEENWQAESDLRTLREVEAIKEGIVAILVSPSFLLINPEEGDAADRFATKLSYFLKSTTPDARMRKIVSKGKLNTFEAVRVEVQRYFDKKLWIEL